MSVLAKFECESCGAVRWDTPRATVEKIGRCRSCGGVLVCYETEKVLAALRKEEPKKETLR